MADSRRGAPLVASFIVETTDRLITVAFKFLPFQVGVGEAGTGMVTQLLGLGGSLLWPPGSPSRSCERRVWESGH